MCNITDINLVHDICETDSTPLLRQPSLFKLTLLYYISTHVI